ncbi:lycopene cyclase [Flavobacteriaceae bacterium TP-CH-4]|uniref:Lycopene cyclase n=2 Tax=Pelagihabitans pacificus TaxID=2696054 RepID=A0A967AWF4_9FLAO|nr:lycopene cyclase [Pelagihabitans pacificus]
MLADAIGKDSFFKNKSILLLDKDAKRTNDRTWCFWEKEQGPFESIVHKRWPAIYFGGKQFSKRFEIAPYHYKMIRGIDFYTLHMKRIENYANVDFLQREVLNVHDDGSSVTVTTSSETFSAQRCFNSIFTYQMATQQTKYPVLQQHFVGWFVKTTKEVFDVEQATYMDFSIPQKGNTRFMYVLPLSPTEALVEYTLFSKELLPLKQYETALETYLIRDLGCEDYQILEEEKGSIPMTCYDFQEHHTQNMRYIGTAGGWAKPSTGYTFMSTIKKVPKLLEYIKTGKDLRKLRFKNKFWYYDLLLLDILDDDNSKGQPIFESLFKNRSPQLIFKFLDEQTNLVGDLRFISAPPSMPFIKAMLGRLF